MYLRSKYNKEMLLQIFFLFSNYTVRQSFKFRDTSNESLMSHEVLKNRNNDRETFFMSEGSIFFCHDSEGLFEASRRLNVPNE